VAEAAYAAREGLRIVEVSPALTLRYDDEGQILVRAEGVLDTSLPDARRAERPATRAGYGYAICYLCGRAEPETRPRNSEKDPVPEKLRKHVRLRGDSPCESKDQYWRHVALAGAVRTETLSFELRGAAQITGRALATTWMVALQLAAGEVLGIDSRSIGGLLVPRSVPGGFVLDAHLYDPLAGGAGHCRALLARWDELLECTRTRLRCPNERCTNGCHRCLIAFETQRYEEVMRRAELLRVVEAHWEEITTTPEREGVKVEALVRGGYELLEEIQRAPSAAVTLSVHAITPDALDDRGWLRPLLAHAEARGRVRLLVERLPDPDHDSERFLARRLAVALESGRLDLRLAKAGTASASGWRVTLSDPRHAFFIAGATEEALGSAWLDRGAVFRACEGTAKAAVLEKSEALFGAALAVSPKDLEPEAAPPTVKWRHVPARETGARATFEYWLKNAAEDSVLARPLKEVRLVDRYIANESQVRLFEELCQIVRKAGCSSIALDTYAPENKANNVSADEQLRRVRAALGNPNWKPMPDPPYGTERIHKRLLMGSRQDGTRFEVLFERGIDFIVERPRVGRMTRETYVIVRDPA
jgi:hypothetical protein